MPSPQHGVDLIDHIRQNQRTPGHDHQHHRLSDGDHSFQQLLLSAGKIKIGPAVRFAGEIGWFTQHKYHGIGLPGSLAGRRKLSTRDTARFCQSGHMDKLAATFSQRGEHGDRVLRPTIQRPHPHLFPWGVGQGADDGQ